MRWLGEALGRLGVSSHFARVAWLRRALLALAIATCSAVALLYWRQQIDDHAPRRLQNNYLETEPQWTWTCRNERCERTLVTETTGSIQSLPTCNMLCSSTQLWPQPTGPMSLSYTAVPVRAEQFSLQVHSSPTHELTDLIKEVFALLRTDLRSLERGLDSKRDDVGAPRDVIVRVYLSGDADPRMRIGTDESYKLGWKPAGHTLMVNLTANSFCGVRHALETLSQLVWLDPYAHSLLALEAASIEDAPRFRYRGLLLDTARNYFPIGEILRTIDGMGASKLNTFHWHISDSQAFPLKLKSAPQLAKHGAYGPGAVYTTEEVQAVVRHARLRGVRVLMEVDAPAHVGRAWDWGPAAGLGQLAHCIEVEPWNTYCGEPPCGQLNPRNPNVYNILALVYAEIIQLTGVDDIFHIGGDEVSERCWAQHFNDTDPMELWLYFTEHAYKALERANGGKAPEMTILWSSGLTRSPYLERLSPQKFGVQVWGASRWPESRAVLDAGFRTVVSHVDAWYLDCGFGSWRDNSEGHCGRFRSWQQVYEHRPWVDEAPGPLPGAGAGAAAAASWSVEGGEACQWTEQLGPAGLDARVWPRAAALAERLWSDRAEGAAPDVYLRLDTHRARLVSRGVRAAPLWPRWCSHNPHACL